MNNLSVFGNESGVAYGQKTSQELLELEKTAIDLMKRRGVKNPSLSLYISMVYGFAENLPYSMDIEQEEYVPGDFLNLKPFDVEENNWFKYEYRRTIYNAMVHWGDTFKSGVLLQVCYIFQQMLLKNIPANFSVSDDDFEKMGFDVFTKNAEYNRLFFEILASLPSYYQSVVDSQDITERRSKLEKMYEDIQNCIGMRIGGFREIDNNGNIIREVKSNIIWGAFRDVELLVAWDYVNIFDVNSFDITKFMKEEQLKKYNDSKGLVKS